MSPEPWSAAPGHLPVAARGDLMAGDRELHQPHVGDHLPHHEAALVVALGGRARRAHAVLLSHLHPHPPGRVHALGRPLPLGAPRGGPELLNYVLSRRRHLHATRQIAEHEIGGNTDDQTAKGRALTSRGCFGETERGERGQPRTLRRILRSFLLLESMGRWLLIQLWKEWILLAVLLDSSSLMGSSESGARRAILLPTALLGALSVFPSPREEGKGCRGLLKQECDG